MMNKNQRIVTYSVILVILSLLGWKAMGEHDKGSDGLISIERSIRTNDSFYVTEKGAGPLIIDEENAPRDDAFSLSSHDIRVTVDLPGSAYIIARSVIFDGDIYSLVDKTFTLNEGGVVEDDLRVGAKRVIIRGEIIGDAALDAKTDVILEGARISGALEVNARSFSADENTVIEGETLLNVPRKKVTIAENALFNGEITYTSKGGEASAKFGSFIEKVSIFFFLALVILLISKKFCTSVNDIAKKFRDPFAALFFYFVAPIIVLVGIGFIGTLVKLGGAVVVLFTLAFAFYALGILLAIATLPLLVGNGIAHHLKKKIESVESILVGAIVLALIGIIPHGIGLLVVTALILYSFGAVLHVLLSKIRG